VRLLSCARLSIGNVLEFLFWKWKPYPRVVFCKSRLVWVLLYIWEVCYLLLKLRVTWSFSLIHCKVMLWHAQNPNWPAFIRPFSPLCLWTIFRIAFSSSLPVVDKRLIGRKFGGNLESFPVFGKVIIFVSFQGVGKWESQRQWLIRWIKCTKGLLGSCLRHSFGMPSILQAFLSFREFTIFCRSHGLILSEGIVVYRFE
jgi:hypothetical protein